MKLSLTEKIYEGSGSFDLSNENSIPVEFHGELSIPSVIGSFPMWDDPQKPISYDGTSTWPSISKPSIDDPFVDLHTNGSVLSQEVSANKIIIGVCCTLGLIIIAGFVGFSFAKRPCSHESITSVTTGTSANLVSQSPNTVYNTTYGMEVTNIAITVRD